MSDERNDQGSGGREVHSTTVVDRGGGGGGGGPFAWIAVIVVIALVAFGIWYFVANSDTGTQDTGDTIEIEQEAPDVDINIEAPDSGGDEEPADDGGDADGDTTE